MQIVIDIPDEIRKSIFDDVYCGIIDKRVFDAIKHGTQLPKGHGKLIDADELKTAFPCGESVRTECVRATIDYAPTIIEADKAESEE